MIKAMKSKTLLLIPIVMFLFSLCGSVFGMAEETIPFIPIFVSLMIAAGYDSITGVAIVFCGASAGFAGAFINPFTIQVAQGIAQLPLLSGMTFRIVMYICMVLLTTITVMLYATKVKKNPQLSPMYEFDQTREDVADLDSLPTFGGREKAILLVFLASIILLIFGVIKKGWYMDEIAALFFGMSMIVAAIGKLGINGYANALAKGMADIAGGALVVGFARGILIVMNDANILHTILHGAAGLLQGLPAMVSAVGRHVHLPVSAQLHRSIRFRTGCGFHADHGAAVRPGRRNKTDSLYRVPVRRWYFQHLHTDLRLLHGGSCAG